MKLYVVGRTAQRVVARNYHSIPINFGIGDWWGYAGKVKPANDVATDFKLYHC